MEESTLYASFDGRTYFQEDLAEKLKEIYYIYRTNDYAAYLDVTDYIIGKTNYFFTEEEQKELETTRNEIVNAGRELNRTEINDKINPKQQKHRIAMLNSEIKELMRKHQITLNNNLHKHSLLIGGGMGEEISDELLL